jgi:hypothetical protein
MRGHECRVLAPGLPARLRMPVRTGPVCRPAPDDRPGLAGCTTRRDLLAASMMKLRYDNRTCGVRSCWPAGPRWCIRSAWIAARLRRAAVRYYREPAWGAEEIGMPAGEGPAVRGPVSIGAPVFGRFPGEP